MRGWFWAAIFVSIVFVGLDVAGEALAVQLAPAGVLLKNLLGGKIGIVVHREEEIAQHVFVGDDRRFRQRCCAVLVFRVDVRPRADQPPRQVDIVVVNRPVQRRRPIRLG